MPTRSLWSLLLILAVTTAVALWIASDTSGPPVSAPLPAAEPAAAGAPAAIDSARAGEAAEPRREAVARVPSAASAVASAAKPAGIVVRGRVADLGGAGLAQAAVSRRASSADRDAGIIERIVGDAMRDALPSDDGKDGQAMTDAQGFFELSLPEPGTFELTATHPEHPPARVEVVGEQAGQRLDGVLLTMPPGVVISGRITGVPEGVKVTVVAAAQRKQEGGAALLHAVGALDSVQALRADRQAPAAADGTFALRGLAVDGDYRVWAVQGEWLRGASAPCCDPARAHAPAQDVNLSYQAALVVTGVLLDAATRAPLSSVDVSSTFTRSTKVLGVSTTSSSSDHQRKQPTPAGRLTLALRPQSKDSALQLTFAADGYRAHEHGAIALEGQTHIDLGEIALTPAPRLRVRVARAGTHEPVAEAKVSLFAAGLAPALAGRRRGPDSAPRGRLAAEAQRRQDEVATASTDRDGVADLTVSKGERGELRVRAEGFAPARVELPALPTEGVVEHVVELVAGGNVHVRVEDPRGHTVAGATVSVQGSDPNEQRDYVCDPDGRARCQHLLPGEYRFSVKEKQEDGVLRVSRANDPQPGVTAMVVEGETKELVLVHVPRVAVTGTVTVNGEPAAGLTVELEPSTRDGAEFSPERELERRLTAVLGGSGGKKTNRQGSFRIDGVALGEYRLTLRRDGELLPASATVVVGYDGARCDVNLTTGVVEGIVVDSAGQPIGAAQVRVVSRAPQDAASALASALAPLLQPKPASEPATESGGVRCGADGRFRIDALGGAEVVVQASASEYCVAVSAPFALQPQQAVRDVRVVLERGGALRVRVSGEGPGVVSATRSGEPALERNAFLRDGLADFGLLPPGRWRVGLGQPGAAAPGATAEVEVIAGQTAECALSR